MGIRADWKDVRTDSRENIRARELNGKYSSQRDNFTGEGACLDISVRLFITYPVFIWEKLSVTFNFERLGRRCQPITSCPVGIFSDISLQPGGRTGSARAYIVKTIPLSKETHTPMDQPIAYEQVRMALTHNLDRERVPWKKPEGKLSCRAPPLV